MISEPFESRGMLGCLVRYHGIDNFKLAIVVGYDRTTKTFLVKLWRAATKQWTKSKTRVRIDEISPLTPEEKRGRKTMINVAIDSASDTLGLRAYA